MADLSKPDAGDVVTLADPPAPSFPWLRSTIGAARNFLARGGTSWRRIGQTPPPATTPTTGGELAASLARHTATTASGMVRGAVDAPFWGAQKALNWYDFARTGYAGFIGGAEMLAPTFGGAPAYLSAASRPGSLGVFGGDVAAGNLTKAGRPTAQAALEMARGMEEKGFTPLEIRQSTNDLIARNEPTLGGVHKGAENKWRFEISDTGAKLTGKAGPTLGDTLHHPELFAAYPGLRSIPYREVPGKGGMYTPPGELFRWAVGQGDIAVGLGNADKLSVILHEVQHAGPQRLERFARGSNLGEAASLDLPAAKTAAEMAERTKAGPYGIYRRVAGEVEARNVQTRQPLSAGERRSMHPELTQDVPTGKQIIITDEKLQRMLQLSPQGKPAVTLNKLREMVAPNKSITTFAYDMINAQGQSIGKINGAFYPAAGELRIHMIQLKNASGETVIVKGPLFGSPMHVRPGEWFPEAVSANVLKPGELKAIVRGLKGNYPFTSMSGIRQTGARGSRGEETAGTRPDRFTDADDLTKIPMSGSLKASTGVPGLQAPPGSGMSIPDEQNFRFQQEERDRLRAGDPDSQFNDYLAGRSYEGMDDPFMHLHDSLDGRLPWRGDVNPTMRDRLRNYFEMRRQLNRGVPGPTSAREITLVADAHIGRSAIRRVEVTAVDDSGPLQMVTVRGLDGETYTAPMGQMFGLSSVPPIGSVGYAFMGNGRPDQAFLLGVEDPTLRPGGRADGEVILYGKEGQFVGMNANGDLVISAPGQVHP